MCISDLVFDSWTQGDLIRVDELLTEEIRHPSTPFYHARALAHRVLVRARSKQRNTAIDDAKMVNLSHLLSQIALTLRACKVYQSSEIRHWSH